MTRNREHSHDPDSIFDLNTKRELAYHKLHSAIHVYIHSYYQLEWGPAPGAGRAVPRRRARRPRPRGRPAARAPAASSDVIAPRIGFHRSPCSHDLESLGTGV